MATLAEHLLRQIDAAARAQTMSRKQLAVRAGLHHETLAHAFRRGRASLDSLDKLARAVGLRVELVPDHDLATLLAKGALFERAPDTVSVKSLDLAVPRFWSGPDEQPVDAVIVAVLANPVFDDLLIVADRFGIERVRDTYWRLLQAGEVPEILHPTLDRMLKNIAAGFANDS